MANEFKVRKGLVVNGSGSVLLDIQGSQGQLFSVTDQLSGSLFSISDISGIPVMEAFSDNTVKIGRYGFEAIKVSGSVASVTGSFSGSFSGSFFGAATSASFASTSSFANSFNVAGNLTASNALLSGTLTAQTLVVQTITSSIDFVTGSTRFGSLLTNTHTFTGSVSITGSLTVNTTGTEFQVTNAGTIIGNQLTDTHSMTGSLRVTGSTVAFAGSMGLGGADQGYQLDVKRTSTGDSTFDTVANFYKASTHNTGLLLRLKNTVVDLTANNITGGGGPTAGMSFSVSSGGTISTALTLDSTGAATFNAATSATTLSTNGAAGQWSTRVNGSSVASSSYGLGVYAGINSSDDSFRVHSYSGTEYFRVRGDGNVGIGNTTPYSILSLPSGTGWNGGLSWNYTSANSSSKRWWINTDQIAYGDFRICTEITQGGGIISSAGTLYERLYISNAGSVVLGLTSDFIGERLRVAGSTSANKPAMAITSANPNVSCPNGTATTVYTFPSYPRVMFYMVFVRFDTGTNANDYAAYAVVAASSVGSKLMTVVNGTAVTLTLSGLNVQINQTSGATQNAVVSVIQIFANGGSD